MRLSIIIPIYNVEAYLKETLDSVGHQEYQDYELILVDDGSTDGSGAICDEYARQDERVRVIHQENGGVSAARNAGVAAAKGDFIGFVDSDDLIEPDMYAALVKIADEYRADVVQCRHNRDGLSERKERKLDVVIKDGEQYVRDIFTHRGREYTNQVSLWTKIYRRELFCNIHFPEGQTYEDEQEAYKLCLKAKKIALVEDELYHYVKREDSIITGISAKKLHDKQLALQDRVYYLPRRLPELEKVCAVSFYDYSASVLLQTYKKDEEYYKKTKKCLKSSYKRIKRHLNFYQKTYYRWLKIPCLEKLVLKNDYEPIQKLIRKLRRKK